LSEISNIIRIVFVSRKTNQLLRYGTLKTRHQEARTVSMLLTLKPRIHEAVGLKEIDSSDWDI
jgi:hypothetical protein